MSCSVVLLALCHLLCTMEATDVDPAYVAHFKAAFTEDLNRRKENTNMSWLKVATALDPQVPAQSREGRGVAKAH